MDSENMNDLRWEQLRFEVEKGIAESLREKFEKELQGKLQEQREAIRAEVHEEYEKKFRSQKAVIGSYWEKVHKEHKEEFQVKMAECRKEAELRLLQIQKECEDKLNDLSTNIQQRLDAVELFDVVPSEKVLKSMPMAEVVQDEVPSITNPEIRDFLQKVVQELEPSSFLKFTRASKTLRTLAEEGFLTTDISLTCTTFEHAEDTEWFEDDLQLALVPYFKKKPLSFKEINYLHEAKFLRVEMEAVIVLDHGREGRLLNAERKLTELLDYLHVKRIDYLQVNAEVDLENLLEKYDVNELRVKSSTMTTDFLLSPVVEKLNSIDLDLWGVRSDESKDAVIRFLKTTRIPKIYIYSVLPSVVVPKVIWKWFNGERDIEEVYFDGIDGPFFDILTRKLKKNGIGITRVTQKLKGATHLEVEKIVPQMYIGKNGGVLVVKEDMEMLRVDYSASEGSVKLTNVPYEDEDEDEDEENEEEYSEA